MDARELCVRIARDQADGVRSAIEARRRMRAADGEVGVSSVVGAYRDSAGVLRLIAVRRPERDRLDVVEIAADEPARVLHAVYGSGTVAERRAFAVAEARLAGCRRPA